MIVEFGLVLVMVAIFTVEGVCSSGILATSLLLDRWAGLYVYFHAVASVGGHCQILPKGGDST